MGFGDWLNKQATNWNEMSHYFKIGCEVMGPPSGVHGMGTPLERAERIAAGRKEEARRLAAEKASKKEPSVQQFGTGTVRGDRNWTPPVHATTQEGRPVTVSFGRGPRDGETLICDGHVDADTFYLRQKDGLKGHDHYLIDGQPAGGIIRGRYTG